MINDVPIETIEMFDSQGNLISRTEVERPDLLYKNQHPRVEYLYCKDCKDCKT